MSFNNNDIKINLLENGLDFILSATKYIIKNDDKYSIKYAILHLSSGVELIFKSVLLSKDWTQLFQKVSDACEEKFFNGDFQSVNSKTCQDRLESICGIKFSEDEKKTLKILRQKRNKLEHFSILDSSDSLKVYFIRVLNMLIDLIKDNFNDSDMNYTEIELLESIRTSIKYLEEFVEYRWKEINSDIEYYSKYNTILICPSCYEKSLITDDGTKCLFCGYRDYSKKVAKKYISRVLNISEYEAIKNGGYYPLHICEECGEESLVYDEELRVYKCTNCSDESEADNVNYCYMCGNPYKVYDINEDIGVCSDCIEMELEKD
ncbi:hypothetical protein G6Y98_02165 [Clostridium perfringens]|uniref:hypothetical protein n=1 Tax=Clostridium perfringens TaxID=1502 RepID=UPI0013E3CCF0|nr:hypothetical protein [Clostridium perfringens]MCX0393747.1 hypothetical protein [Clostridium perfringens]MDH2475908.1 hypothetical protein [Clostridium perfringens]NGT94631.1 hypothetical protein [Clostridium perfringens]